jgi:hypothetical protein
VNFDEITFPADSAINIRTVRSYMATAMILWYNTDLRAKYNRVWEALKYAWLASFDKELCAEALETWPTSGPYAFSEAESLWLTGTLQFLKAGSAAQSARSRRRSTPATRSNTKKNKEEGESSVKKQQRRDSAPPSRKRYATSHLLFSLIALLLIILIISVKTIFFSFFALFAVHVLFTLVA